MQPTTIGQLAYISVAQVLQSIGQEDGALPPGCQGRLSASIDQLRMTAAPSKHISLAEEISLRVHLLSAAVQRRDEAAAADLRIGIQSLSERWTVPA
jgi:hypothetical protein